MPKLILGNKKEIFITKKKAKEVYAKKYGVKGMKAPPPSTPISIEGYGSIPVGEIKQILEDQKSSIHQNNFTEDEIKAHDELIKSYKGFDNYCEGMGYIRKDKHNKIVVVRHQEYTSLKEIHRASEEKRIRIKKFKEDSLNNLTKQT